MARGRRPGPIPGLAQRERQILDLLYRMAPATAAEVQEAMDPPLTNATIRTILRALEVKGYVGHVVDGNRHVYTPRQSPTAAARKAFDRIVSTFFSGSLSTAFAHLLDRDAERMSDQEFDQLARLIEEQRQRRSEK
ncbi:MAG: BlaI/MecI/CopY family transcriptional regulator [Lysobacterales bacterium]|nr:BlaI/MecI/CopY family transcriptional regulator [Xanthomonadales bacterium]MCB1611679.1 BlaI/MecI/CopY family transcriptional regulator [Xanthomonadales bacterium]MCP5473602.1 BlaI/MecI/CopY family transcriptional regulator [Rhodanobacteraceae bacterium]